MNATSFRCKAKDCGFDNEIFFEIDGYKVLEVWTEDGELNCEVCGESLDRDEVYTAVSIDHAGDLTDAASDYEPADR